MLYSEQKSYIPIFNKILTLFIVSCFTVVSFAQLPVSSKVSNITPSFTINNETQNWFSSRRDIKKANEWLSILESSEEYGFIPDKLQIKQIRNTISNRYLIDSAQIEKTDQQITSLILKFIKDMQQGIVHFEYDEVSVPRDSVYRYQLKTARYGGRVSRFVSQLDCKDPDYLVLKKYLKDSITDKNSLHYKEVVLAMNYRRYLTLNHHSEYVLVNIPTTEVEYYKNNQLEFKMRSVVGTKRKQTNTIASYITNVVTFPYWTVPYSIAVKEILPKVQKDEDYLEQHNFEVVDSKGNVVEDSVLNWNDYPEKDFPYFFRQSTGADNSLGTIKFDLQNPFSIFLHATSWQGAFAKDYRFLSHGCIRLEKPFELADALLRGKIDIQELKTGKKYTESTIIKLPVKIPVFIYYLPVKVEGNQVTFLPDVYGLVQ